MFLERVTLPGRPLWLRMAFFTTLVAASWCFVGLMSAWGGVAILFAGPAMLILLLFPLGMALVLERGGPEFGAMVAVGLALTFTAFTVPGDLYLKIFGESREAVVVEEICSRSKGSCSWSYDLAGKDDRPVAGSLRHGDLDVGDEVRVVADPVGVVPPRRPGDVSFDLLDLVALAAWLGCAAVLYQGAQAVRRPEKEPHPPVTAPREETEE
ncbi:hypothetical protein ABGB12_15055 [Actinocorallia sp. B10E7]|uniref:hypothetical protein n=1 Tax=Actinocorallia sp. B10E7 TaxID=3153558 RepID=UPI00325C360A